MERTELQLTQEILLVEEEINSWYPWHCNKHVCYDHACRVRLNKLYDLECKLHDLDVRRRVLRNQKRIFIASRLS